MENTHTSLARVLYVKFVEFVAEQPLCRVAKFIGLSFLVGVLSSLLTAPDATQTALYEAMHWKNGILTAVVWSVAIVFYSPKVLRLAYSQILELVEFFSDQSCESDETIEGIPVTELVDHLFEEKSFKREEVESKFGIPRNRYHRLAEKMEEMEILVRGENNSRVLSPDVTRGEVVEHFKGKRVAMDLDTLRIVRSPTSADSFTTRNIAQTA